LDGLRAYLLQKGVEPDAADRQVLRLTRADTSVYPPHAAGEAANLTPPHWQRSAPSEPAVLSDEEASLVPTERASSSDDEASS
jgi:hypothetical protein